METIFNAWRTKLLRKLFTPVVVDQIAQSLQYLSTVHVIIIIEID